MTCTRIRTGLLSVPGEADVLEVWPVGEIDLAWQEDLDRLVQAFEAGRARDVLIHGEDVTFISSTGINAYWRLADLAHARGGRLVLAGTTGIVARALQLVGLDLLVRVDRPALGEEGRIVTA